jgi:serine/threonine-protein kinase HipA
MIRVWTDNERAGVLDRLEPRSSTFVYEAGVSAAREVSLTMPLRTSSWDTPYGLAPIFEMNLPEGALRARLARQFAKAAGKFDDLDLLGVVGRSQLGRIRYSGLRETLGEDVPLQSVDDILRARRDGGLFDYLLNQFAQHSGLSGVQPKVMVRDPDKAFAGKTRRSSSLRGATHIVKFWDEREYPELAANEFFCLTVAKRLGLEVPAFELSEDGGALVVERFDLADGAYLGFEDFCVLNALRTEEKYRGSYETALFRRMKQFVSATRVEAASRSLFTLFVLNCVLRNGDAHLKNFGVLYPATNGEVWLAPVYDIITTAVYVPGDTMALTLEGRTTWPDAAALGRLGQIRAGLAPREVAQVFEAVADAVADVMPALRTHFRNGPSAQIGEAIAAAWRSGVRESLGPEKGSPH